MNTDPPARGRNRPRLASGRKHRLFLRLSDDEYHDVTTAARRFGLTPTGFCSQAAVDTARNLHPGAHPMEQQTLSSLQAELFHARVTLNQLRAELSETRTDSRATTDHLDKTIRHAAEVLTGLDSAISRIHRRIRQQ